MGKKLPKASIDYEKLFRVTFKREELCGLVVKRWDFGCVEKSFRKLPSVNEKSFSCATLKRE